MTPLFGVIHVVPGSLVKSEVWYCCLVRVCMQATSYCRHATATMRHSTLVVTHQMKLSTCTAPSTDVDQLGAVWNRARSSTHSDRTSATTAVTPTSSALPTGSVAVVTSAPSDYLIQTSNESPRATRIRGSIWRLDTRVRKVRSIAHTVKTFD